MIFRLDGLPHEQPLEAELIPGFQPFWGQPHRHVQVEPASQGLGLGRLGNQRPSFFIFQGWLRNIFLEDQNVP
jgi:hypothetical protein